MILKSRWREDYGLSFIWPPLVMLMLFGARGVQADGHLATPDSGGCGAGSIEPDPLLRLSAVATTHALPLAWTTLLLDRLYASWFLPMTATFLACAFVSDRGHLRTQYVLAFVWTWLFTAGLLGYLLGFPRALFRRQPSGGCDHYSDLMGVLRSDDAAIARLQPGSHLFALKAQHYLETL